MLLKTASLTPFLRNILIHKKTEYPHTGLYQNASQAGTYLCRQCGLALFRTDMQFHSGCGWPSFDEEIAGTVKRVPDADGSRMEILCSQCDGHLGHVFEGEGFTAKNLRHCVNSASLDFVADSEVRDTEEAIIAAGCFWGVEYLFQQLEGVVKTEVGYCGGHLDSPDYQAVCKENSGHLESLRIVFDPQKVSYTEILKYFFEIHDFTQNNGQGPDIGEQYKSAIFYYDSTQSGIANELMTTLKNRGFHIATSLLQMAVFWSAEEYHQHYYQKNKKTPYCHMHRKIW